MSRTQPIAISVSAAVTLTGCLFLAACDTNRPAGDPITHAASAPAAESPAPNSPSAPDPSGTPDASAVVTTVVPQPASLPVDACSLVTEQDVTTAVGTDPGPGSATTNPSQDASQCQYGSYPDGILLINTLPTRGKAAYDRLRNNPKRPTGSELITVDAVGDQAFEESSPLADAVSFTKGDILTVIGFSTPRSAPPKGAAVALAKIAASRL